VTARQVLIAEAFRWACLAELEAPKPGNVHFFANGHRMTATEFVASADAAAPPLSAEGARVGERILGAVEATFAAVGSNTNLGIILLCAPLAAAAEHEIFDLRTSLIAVLRGLDTEDAKLTYRAIVLAAPAGLGRSERHDVLGQATTSLLDAMTEAADRDRIARQYATSFSDIFDVGLPRLEAAAQRHPDLRWATLATYLEFLSAFPDTHIVRKHGPHAAEGVCQAAAALQRSLQTTENPETMLAGLLTWDAALKADGINPGTSADLTVATLFANRLKAVLPSKRKSG
jgi:triphosphoribosyl-dephospho-CoA synthase